MVIFSFSECVAQSLAINRPKIVAKKTCKSGGRLVFLIILVDNINITRKK